MQKYLEYNSVSADERLILDCLFSKKELKQKLNKGFLGYPLIGSVIMPDIKNQNFYKNFLKPKIDNGKDNSKIFLVSSIFGGTGAAGYPEISRILAGDFNNVSLGGSVILPYFALLRGQIDDGNLHPDSTKFLQNTSGALPTYQDENFVKTNPTYYLGDRINNRELKDTQCADGSKEQKNDAHFIELLAALSALDFHFTDRKGNYCRSIKGEGQNTKIVFDDLPEYKAKETSLEYMFKKFGLFVFGINDLETC